MSTKVNDVKFIVGSKPVKCLPPPAPYTNISPVKKK